MKKRKLLEFLHSMQNSTLDEVDELRKSYESLENLKDDDEIPARIKEELEHVLIVRRNPKVPHFPLAWKQFIPETIEEDLSAIVELFAKGDLVYGLSGSRILLFSLLEENNKADFAAKPGLRHNATIDPYIDIFLASAPNLNDPFYAPAQSFKSFAILFKPELEKFSYALHVDDTPFIKKMSKLGILWTLNNEHKLHFVLDNIDYKMCFEKKFDKFTFAELRFIYRYWEQLKPYYQQGKINFYFMKDKKLIKINAPWESKADIVSTYIPKHSHKTKYHAFFNSFLVALIKNEIKSHRWRTGLWGLGGGSPITVDDKENIVPHRIAKIFNVANDENLSLAAKYLMTQKIAREAIDNPRWFQKSETTEFYQKILDFDKSMANETQREQRFFKSKPVEEPNFEEKKEMKL